MINLKIFLPIALAMLVVMVCGAMAFKAGWFGLSSLAVIILVTGIAGGRIYVSFATRSGDLPEA